VRHVAGIQRLAVERLAGLVGLDAGAARHHAGIKGLAADRAPRHRSRRSGTACWGARHVAGIERLAPIAGFDAGAARHRAGIKGLAAECTTGIAPRFELNHDTAGSAGLPVRAGASSIGPGVLRNAVGDTDMKGLRDRAILLLGFAGAFRRSELVALDVTDLEFCDGGMRVHIRRSKTDQEGAGDTIAIVARQRV
jgi:hypothetical protein